MLIKNVPRHIAIIPDGNRRWATSRGLKPWAGHRIAFKHFEEVFEAVLELKILYFSIWLSSKENLKKRPRTEVRFLLNLFKKKFAELAESEKIHKNQVRIDVIGEWGKQLSYDVQMPIKKAIKATKDYNKFFLNFFVAYSGVDEMLNAVRKIKKQNKARISHRVIKDCLFTKNLPPVDFLIRTGGEAHMSSGFMMWDIANAELYFSDKFYPDFTAEDLKEAVKDYSRRRRCFGA